MELKEKINGIIDRRLGRGVFKGKGHLEVIKEKKEFFKALQKTIEDYETLRSNILNQINLKQGEYYTMSLDDPGLESKVEIADSSKIQSQIKLSICECEKLEQRFGRESINISVIGLAGQGKSTLLQSIADIDNAIIPAADGSDCTGAKSVICNNNSPTTYAKIIFYNDVEIIEQIGRYISALQMPFSLGSTNQIPSISKFIDEFKKQHTEVTSDGKSKTTLSTAEKKHLLHLEKYVEHYKEYAHLIGTVHTENDETKIRDYVAQYKEDGTKTFYYLAVKEAQIYTKFKYEDAGKIVLVDTIGLGDTALGIREKMISTLRNDSDAAIMIRFPRYGREDELRQEDVELCSLIEKSIGRDQLSKWLFFVINKSSENEEVAKQLKKHLESEDFNCALLALVNCAKQDDVENGLLIPMLQILADNLVSIDNGFMEKANDVFAIAYQLYFDLYEKISNIITSDFKKRINNEGLFDEVLYKELRLAQRLEEVNMQYADHKHECPEIKDEIFKTLKTLRKLRPTKDVILSRLSRGDETARPEIVYLNMADHFRAIICDQFEEINNSVIIKLQDDFKNQIINVLQSENGGKLSLITLNSEYDNSDPQAWLSAFIEQYLNDYPLIKSAFEDILKYQLNIEGILEYRINNSIEHLDRESPGFHHIMFGTDREQNAEEIDQALLRAIPRIAEYLRENVSDILYIPYNSFYARIKKLREHIIYSEEGQMELKRLYRNLAPYIWKDMFKANVSKQSALTSLNSLFKKLEDNRTKGQFIIKIESNN